MEPVRYERRAAAAVVTIDSQERRNAIDGPTAELLAEAHERFESEDDARVLILTGAGGVAFSSGADLKAIETFGARLDDPRGPVGIIIGLGRALDLILTGRTIDAPEALAIGLVTEVVRGGRHLERALEIAEGLARLPQDTLLADRRAAIEGSGLTLEEGLALEARSGSATLGAARRGAARFAAGEGRGGAGAGV